jgi:nucleoside phosphorylase
MPPEHMALITSQLRPDDYAIACICPLALEMAPLQALLEEIHPAAVWSEKNSYTLGRIGKHNVVLATMPETGNNSAASVIAHLTRDFKAIKFGLLVGIGGGLPSNEDDIRLGDVVVGLPRGTCSGVIQFDRGRVYPGNFFERTGFVNKPPDLLLSTVQNLRSRYALEGSPIPRILANVIGKFPQLRANGYFHPGEDKDILFSPEYTHLTGTTCESCDQQCVVKRHTRPTQDPFIHYGCVGSSNTVIKDGIMRDALKQELNLLCVEMEAAGVIDLPFLVIRGISDYADSHKNKTWQQYAAAVAAAYATDLLSILPPLPPLDTSSSATNNRALRSEHGDERASVNMKADKIFYRSEFNSSGSMYF